MLLKIQKINFCFILFLTSILFFVSAITVASNVIKQSKKQINNNYINFSLKKLNESVSVDWINDKYFYYINQHNFQRLFLEEWIKTMPNLKNNKLIFLYKNNIYSFPVEVIVKYINPSTNKLINFWVYKIK